MATLISKYDVGQTVFVASTTQTIKRLPCPDCNDTRQWQAISPGGRGYLFGCPRCSQRYRADHALNLDVPIAAPHVYPLVIAEIDYSNYNPRGFRYKSWTSPGGGAVYNEDQCFTSEAEALRVATLLAGVETQRIAENQNRYHGYLEVCDYQLDQAGKKAVESEFSKYRWKVSDLLEDLDMLASGDGYKTLDEILAKHFPHRATEGV